MAPRVLFVGRGRITLPLPAMAREEMGCALRRASSCAS